MVFYHADTPRASMPSTPIARQEPLLSLELDEGTRSLCDTSRASIAIEVAAGRLQVVGFALLRGRINWMT